MVMYDKFKYDRIALSSIQLDSRNPRIVRFEKPKNEAEIIEYFFKHEDLASFIKKIASEGRNKGAERPYLVKEGKGFVVIEGNTRIATYKLLTGLLTASEDHLADVPHVAEPIKAEMAMIDCTIAPSRDALLPIMANAHFGLGDKSRWGYLGSRKAVFDEYISGKSLTQLASVFDRKKGQIRDLILEYKLYLEALKGSWTQAEREELEDPSVEFNPPVRFLQTANHMLSVGINYDRVNLEVEFKLADSKSRFYHLIRKLVVTPEKGLGATASYQDVFLDYQSPAPSTMEPSPVASDGASDVADADSEPKSGTSVFPASQSDQATTSNNNKKPLPGTLFNYPVKSSNQVIIQLLKEAGLLNTNKLPASGTGLLRCVIEAILKSIIYDQSANPQNKLLSLESALDICLSNNVNLSQDDKKILKDFKKHHLDYINLGAHATAVPNTLRLMAARDSIDQFVMRHI